MKPPALLSLLVCLAGTLSAAEPWTAVGSGHMDLTLLREGAPELAFETRVIGPQWRAKAFPHWEAAMPVVEDGSVRVYENPETAVYARFFDFPAKPLLSFGIRQEVVAEGDSALHLRYVVTPETNLTLGMPQAADSLTVGPVIAHRPFLDGGTARVTQADGKTTELALPINAHSFPKATEVVLTTAGGERIRIDCDPALFLHCDAAELRSWKNTG